MRPCGGLSRRAFVTRGALGLGALAVLESLTGCAAGMVHSVAPSPEGRLRLSLRDFPELNDVGGVATVHVDGEEAPIFIVREGERDYVALSSVCTHRGCTVEATANGFACPCHGSRYGRGGEVVRGPAARSLQRLTTSIAENGTLEVALRGGDQA
jgi:Rieske Fe-S protein